MVSKISERAAIASLIPVKTRPLLPPQDALWDALDPALPPLQDGDVVAFTSKVVAIHQGRCVATDAVADKEELVAREAEAWIPKASSKYGVTLAIKGGTLIASAGIDASNASGHYVLWPSDPWGAAREIAVHLKHKHALSRLGVILTDSHCIPLRRGTVGISISCFGFEPAIRLSRTTRSFRPSAGGHDVQSGRRNGGGGCRPDG
jgi:F420-0:gamma-glutamyl ligase